MLIYKVEDNFIPSYHQECIERHLSTVAWQYDNDISGIGNIPKFKEDLFLSKRQDGFAANIFSGEWDDDQILLGLCLPIVAKAKESIPGKMSLERIRAGKFLAGDGGLHRPHVDYYTKHYTILYYANNSDGNTYLFNERSPERSVQDGAPEYPDSFSLIASIKPKRGRVLIFDGLNYHSSSLPKISKERLAININVMVDNE